MLVSKINHNLEVERSGKKNDSLEKVHALFANPARLLLYYHTLTAVPHCVLRNAFHLENENRWHYPKKTQFPVIVYDQAGNYKLVEVENELSEALGPDHGFQEVILYQVPKMARFVWVDFKKNEKPKIINYPQMRLENIQLDQDIMSRINKVNWLFFNDGLERFRLLFVVDTDDGFTLMGGASVGY